MGANTSQQINSVNQAILQESKGEAVSRAECRAETKDIKIKVDESLPGCKISALWETCNNGDPFCHQLPRWFAGLHAQRTLTSKYA